MHVQQLTCTSDHHIHIESSLKQDETFFLIHIYVYIKTLIITLQQM